MISNPELYIQSAKQVSRLHIFRHLKFEKFKKLFKISEALFLKKQVKDTCHQNEILNQERCGIWKQEGLKKMQRPKAV